MKNFEMRMNPTSISTSEDGKMYCEGLVNGTETWSHEMGIHRKFVEKVKKGTFTRAIQNAPRIDFLAEHDSTKLLASTENGSLELFEDSEGLKMRAEICPTSYGKDMYELMKSGMVRHMSFGFKSLKDKWEKRANGLYERTIEDMKLIEVSVVRNPAYAMSGISARNIEVIEDVEIPAEVEEVKEETSLQEKEVANVEVTEQEQRALTIEQLQSAIGVLTEYMDSLKETEAPTEENAEVIEEDAEAEKSEEVENKEITEETVKEIVEEIVEEIAEEVTEKEGVTEEISTEEQSVEEVIEEVVEQIEEVQEEKTEDSVNEVVVSEELATENIEETVEEIKVEEQPSFDLTKYRQLIKEDIVL